MKRKRGVTVESTLEFRFLFTIRHESTPMEQASRCRVVLLSFFRKGRSFLSFRFAAWSLSQSIALSVLCGLVHRRDTVCMTRSHKRAKISGERRRKDARRFFRVFSSRRLISFVPPNFSRILVVLIGQPGESAIFVNSNYPLIIHSPIASSFLLFTLH